MHDEEVVNQLSGIAVNPSEAIYSITMHDIINAIVHRLGEKALTLTNTDLQLAREEVNEAINHNLDIREYIDIGLDSWEITRKL